MASRTQLRKFGQWLELTKHLTGNQGVLNYKPITEGRIMKNKKILKGSGSRNVLLMKRI